MKKERDYNIDLIRILAMVLIVLMHSPMPGSVPGFIMVANSYLTAPGIGLFFMVSGSLLLNNKLSQTDFLKRRFSKVFYPTLIWTFFYLAIKIITEHITAVEVVNSIATIPFTAQGHGVLWFMYTLAGLYLLTPILSKWIKSASKREIEFYLLLWLITLIYPYFKLVLDIRDDNTNILFYFSGYLGYFVLGYYLRHHYKFHWLHITLAVVIGVICPIWVYTQGYNENFYELLWYLSLPVVCLAFTYYNLLCKINIKKEIRFLTLTSSLCFGIYLVHIFIMRSVLWKLSIISNTCGILSIILIAILTFTISWCVSWCISKLPIGKYIIGT